METKLLDLNAYGVSELSSVEMRETEGGWGLFLLGVLAGAILSEVLDRNCSIQNFRDGYNSVR